MVLHGYFKLAMEFFLQWMKGMKFVIFLQTKEHGTVSSHILSLCLLHKLSNTTFSQWCVKGKKSIASKQIMFQLYIVLTNFEKWSFVDQKFNEHVTFYVLFGWCCLFHWLSIIPSKISLFIDMKQQTFILTRRRPNEKKMCMKNVF